MTSEAIQELIYQKVVQPNAGEAEEIFAGIYQALIGQISGVKLGTFLA
ncbi:MAG: hypothetical protein OXC40_03330 [Proteobacteria bacterium]|nr:hypothetical protein [Pseudomonadota bacterium]